MDVTQIAYWHWWVVALLLAILEMTMPGTLLIFFAGAAAVVGVLAFLVPTLGWQVEFLLFGALSVAGIFVYRRYRAANPEQVDGTDRPTLNKRADQYVGQAVVLVEPIVNGHGKAKVDDTLWRVAGPDLPAGTTVRVVRADGGFLTVEKA